jgi:hypothetical protein
MATREIWRWTLDAGGNEIKMPEKTKFLSVGTKDGVTVEMWGVVDVDAPLETRRFTVIGTGHPWRDDPTINMDYRGTVVLMSGAIVVHVFEGVTPAPDTVLLDARGA